MQIGEKESGREKKKGKKGERKINNYYWYYQNPEKV